MIIYAPNRHGTKYLINTLLTPMEKKAHMAWAAAINRCKNPGCTHYAEYGGRGIAVCLRWVNSFEDFVKDVGLPPSPEHSIERKDCNGNYEPGNVKWALDDEQHRNRRNTRWLDVGGGKMMVMADIAREAGVSISTIFLRVKLGWTGAQLLTGRWGISKRRANDLLTIGHKTQSIEDWAKQIGIDKNTMLYRLDRGMVGKKLLAPRQRTPIDVTINGVTKSIQEWAAQIPMDPSAFRKRVVRGETGEFLLRPAIKGRPSKESS